MIDVKTLTVINKVINKFNATDYPAIDQVELDKDLIQAIIFILLWIKKQENIT
jgi:hypothetical protein